jgi:Zn-dependent protease
MTNIQQLQAREGSAFSRFMAATPGRIARVAFGASLIGAGVVLIPAPAGLAVAGFGLVPIAAGVFNLCPVAPLWGGHFFGAKYCAPKKRS